MLASASPRRRELLRGAGIEHRVGPTGVDESVDSGLSPEDVVLVLAERKARAALPASAGDPVLGADTVVALDGELLDKPCTPDRARSSLRRLSGRAHEVFTGLYLLDPSAGRSASRVVRTEVTFRELAAAEIEAYVDSGEPLDKAGAYGIQGAAREFVEAVRGPVDNVIGLPVDALREMLEELS